MICFKCGSVFVCSKSCKPFKSKCFCPECALNNAQETLLVAVISGVDKLKWLELSYRRLIKCYGKDIIKAIVALEL